jgi:GNAT superfamily N-acetyltransferase
MAAHGEVFFPAQHEGFLAVVDSEISGWVTYRVSGAECEILILDSLQPKSGAGSALIKAVHEEAARCGCQRLWLITTNDNLNALRFYQKRGFELACLHRGAVSQSRRLKPEIPLLGDAGIPIRDEIELEMCLPSPTVTDPR